MSCQCLCQGFPKPSAVQVCNHTACLQSLLNVLKAYANMFSICLFLSTRTGYVTAQGILVQVVEEGGIREGAQVLAEHQSGASTAAC